MSKCLAIYVANSERMIEDVHVDEPLYQVWYWSDYKSVSYVHWSNKYLWEYAKEKQTIFWCHQWKNWIGSYGVDAQDHRI